MRAEAPIRLIVADDHPVVLQGLQQVFQLTDGFELVCCCADGTEALEMIRLHQPDVAVLDLRMPGLSGIEVARRLAEPDAPTTRLVLLTAEVEEEVVIEAVSLGVRGVLLKEMAARHLVDCVRKVHGGERWIERGSYGRALETLARREASATEVAKLLTPRELEVVRLVGRGLRNREIAEALYISEGTTKVHLHRIFTKLGIETRSALARFAADKGLV